MRKGGPELDRRTLQVTRVVALITPTLASAYGLLVLLGYTPNDHFYSFTLFAILSSLWVFYATYQFLKPSTNFANLVVMLGVYHLFAVAFLLFVTGFSTAFLSGWALLYLMSYFCFYLRGFIVSISILVFFAFIDIASRHYSMHEAATVLLNVTGTALVGCVGVAITYFRLNEQSALHASQQREVLERDRILTIVNNLADAVFSTDHNGVIRIYNASSLNLLDTNKDINGQHINDVLHLFDKDNNSVALFDLIKVAKSVTVNDDLAMKSGDDVMRLEITYAPIRSSFSREDKTGTGDGFIIIARDVTKLKSLEEERDEFISVVSHELRTPIAVAEGTISNVQLMFERGIKDQAKVDEGLKEAHQQVVFLANMINDLSTLSRAERGITGEIEDIDITAMAHDLYNEYSPDAIKHNLHFNLELGARLGTIHTSRLYLHELLQDFITNAIKYTHEGSVTLKISKHEHILTFAVIDTGIGISKSDQAKVFGKFYRSEDYRTRETGGTGLGLYVALKLAKKLGTTIELKSRLNHGSTFSFTLLSDKPAKTKIAIR